MRTTSFLAPLAVVALAVVDAPAQTVAPTTAVDTSQWGPGHTEGCATNGRALATFRVTTTESDLELYEEDAAGAWTRTASKQLASAFDPFLYFSFSGRVVSFVGSRIAFVRGSTVTDGLGHSSSSSSAGIATIDGAGSFSVTFPPKPSGWGQLLSSAGSVGFDGQRCMVVRYAAAGPLFGIDPNESKVVLTMYVDDGSGAFVETDSIDLDFVIGNIYLAEFDGDVVAVHRVGSPSVDVYDIDAQGHLSPAQTLVASDPGASTSFGSTFAVEGDRIVVVDPAATIGVTTTGAAYVFERPAGSSGSSWSETAKVTPTTAPNGEVAVDASLSAGRIDLVARDPLGPLTMPTLHDVFRKDASGTWIATAQLVLPSGTASESLYGGFEGHRVARSFDHRYIHVYEVGSLAGEDVPISVAAGGAQSLRLEPGNAYANHLYFVFGSISGTSPGVPVPDTPWTLPLVHDVYFDFTTWTLFGGGLVAQPSGLVGLDGTVETQFAIWPGFPAVFAGLTVHHAYVLLDSFAPGVPVSHVSNAVSVQLLP
ncbi:MAG: FG-GAP repeat protein [Planctomycetota bacterium]